MRQGEGLRRLQASPGSWPSFNPESFQKVDLRAVKYTLYCSSQLVGKIEGHSGLKDEPPRPVVLHGSQYYVCPPPVIGLDWELYCILWFKGSGGREREGERNWGDVKRGSVCLGHESLRTQQLVSHFSPHLLIPSSLVMSYFIGWGCVEVGSEVEGTWIDRG